MSDGYPSDWDQRRKKVYQRDNYTCQNCGAKGGPHGNAELHAHHIVPKSKGGTHKISNLKTICNECHNAIHGEVDAPTLVGGPTQTEVDFDSELLGSGRGIKGGLPINKEKYPNSVSGKIDRANLVYEVSQEMNEIADSYKDLKELLNLQFTTMGTNNQLIQETEEVKNELLDHVNSIDAIEENLSRFDDSNLEPEELEVKREFQNSIKNYVGNEKEVIGKTSKAIFENDSRLLNSTDYAMLKRRYNESTKDMTHSYMAYLDHLLVEILDEKDKMQQSIFSRLFNSFLT